MPHIIVLHEIKQSDVWKGMAQDEEKMASIRKAVTDSKFEGEMGFGTDVLNKQFCLWYCPDEESVKEFPEFFHRMFLPQNVADSSKNYVVADHAVGLPFPPGEQFEQKGKGTFALVHHVIKDHAKLQVYIDDWLSKGQDVTTSLNHEHGFHNHQFMPTTGETEKTDIFCVWELREGKSKEDLRKYLDTYLLKPDAVENIVYLLNETSGQSINLPTSKWA